MNSSFHEEHAKSKTDGRSSVMLDSFLEPFRPFLDDNDLTEIAVNRPHEIWTEGSGGWKHHETQQLSFEDCEHLARLIATYNAKSENEPIVSGTLPNGERIQVVTPPACEPGTVSITIRKPSMIDKTLNELEAEGAFDLCVTASNELQEFEHELLTLKKERRIKDFLDLAVRRYRNILIVGKTGSGKTTITKSLIRSIPSEERLITIEDVHELFLNQPPNKVHLYYASEASAKVSARQALASCLRMKPDRILLAEMRGDESWEFVKSINTGHPGSISTMHANGAYEAFEQLAALIKDSHTGAHLDMSYITRRLFSTIDVVLFYDRRKLREIYYDPEFKHQQMGE